jgi:hypothetical protein
MKYLGLLLAALLCTRFALAADDGLLLHYPLDEGSGASVKDVAGGKEGQTSAQEKGQVSGASVLAEAADTWIPILTREGIQRKDITPGSESLLAEGERPIVLDRDADFVMDYKGGRLKAIAGGKMELGIAATMEFKFKNEGPQWVEGKSGKALEFDGLDDFVQLGHQPAAAELQQATLQLWLKLPQEDSSDALVLAKYSPDGRPVYGIRLVKGAPQFFHQSLKSADGKAAPPTAAATPLPRAQWVLLTATFDGHGAALFVNGQEVARQENLTGALTAGGDFYIGGIRDPNFLCSEVDEVKIFSRALLPAEVVRCVF